jgi:hypothetical protein
MIQQTWKWRLLHAAIDTTLEPVCFDFIFAGSGNLAEAAVSFSNKKAARESGFIGENWN